MSVWIALLRGINVGGKNKLPMKDLVATAESIGWQNPRTYIQSGNMVFEAESPSADDLTVALNKSYNLAPRILILSADDFEAIMTACPFESSNGKDVHVYFLDGEATTNIEKLNELKAPSEQWKIGERAFYLFAPDGIARSKLAAGAEKALGVPATARNWNTIQAISNLIK